MSKKLSQTARGKAFEYACLCLLEDVMNKQNVVYNVLHDDAYNTAEMSFNQLDDETKEKYIAAAKTAMKIIIPLEPRLIERSGTITLFISTDNRAKGKDGDVRDVICLRSDRGWEVGFSCKHNHEALKHPRLTQAKRKASTSTIADFGTDWIGYPCSEEYFSAMSEQMKVIEKQVGKSWEQAFGAGDEKYDVAYVPLLKIIMKEIRKLCDEHPDAPSKLLSYFFGSNDFYKIISMERVLQTKVVAFNMNGTLNAASESMKAITKIPKLHLPTRLIEIGFKIKSTGEISKTTMSLVFDHGWTINMRLHSADSKVKTTGLKFDVSLEGNPHGIYQQQRSWLEG